MKRILLALKQSFRHSLMIGCLMVLFGLGLLILPNQPVYAGIGLSSNPVQKQSQVNNKYPENPATVNRDEAYEEAVEAAQSPEGIEKEYQEDLQAYQTSHPEQGVVKTAEKLIEKVTNGEDPVLH